MARCAECGRVHAAGHATLCRLSDLPRGAHPWVRHTRHLPLDTKPSRPHLATTPWMSCSCVSSLSASAAASRACFSCGGMVTAHEKHVACALLACHAHGDWQLPWPTSFGRYKLKCVGLLNSSTTAPRLQFGGQRAPALRQQRVLQLHAHASRYLSAQKRQRQTYAGGAKQGIRQADGMSPANQTAAGRCCLVK